MLSKRKYHTVTPLHSTEDLMYSLEFRTFLQLATLKALHSLWLQQNLTQVISGRISPSQWMHLQLQATPSSPPSCASYYSDLGLDIAGMCFSDRDVLPCEILITTIGGQYGYRNHKIGQLVPMSFCWSRCRIRIEDNILGKYGLLDKPLCSSIVDLCVFLSCSPPSM
jgi:hypothetical protein